MKPSIILFSLMVLFQVSHAQKEACEINCDSSWCWGNVPEEAKKNWTALDNSVVSKKMKEAESPLEWLLANTPCLNKALYINGEKVYKALEREAKNDSIEVLYQDKLMALYYQRIEYFGDEKLVKDKIGALAYSFYVNRGGCSYEEKRPYWTKMYNIYDDILKRNGNESKYYHVRYFMLSANKMFMLNKDTVAFMQAYNRCEEIFDDAIPRADEKIKAKWEETRNAVNSTPNGDAYINCAFVKSKWIPQLKKDSSNIKLAKKAIRFMIQDKCTDDPDFMFLVNIVYQKEYTPMDSVRMHLREKDYEKAEQFYREMIKMAGGEGSEGGTSEEDPAMQAEGYMAIAGIKAKQNKYSEARDLYLEAAALDANQASKAYTNIGDLYVRTATSCLPPEEERNPITNQAPYLAAYEMYERAGNKAKMSSARGAFPTKTETFTWLPTCTRETTVQVYGWIGGTATIRVR